MKDCQSTWENTVIGSLGQYAIEKRKCHQSATTLVSSENRYCANYDKETHVESWKFAFSSNKKTHVDVSLNDTLQYQIYLNNVECRR